MPDYAELVKRARRLHERLGEEKFRELYEKYPTTLAKDLGVHTVSKSIRNLAGNRVLQAFGFFPLSPALKETYESILEARGLIRLKESPLGKVHRRLIITHVLENGAWK